MAFKIGQEVLFNGEKYTILEKRNGGKTKKPVMQSGCVFVGFASKPPTYKLREGLFVRGNKLKKIG